MSIATERDAPTVLVTDETLVDLRSRLRLSQRAFARLASIVPAQVWLLEHGKVERPQKRTAEKYARLLGISVEDFFRAHLNTNRITRDPNLAETAALERRIRDIFPRASRGQTIDLSGNLVGLGGDLVNALFDRANVRWLGLAAAAEWGLQQPALRNWHRDARFAVARAALICVTELCRTALDDRDVPSDGVWRERLIHVVDLAFAITRQRTEATELPPDPVDLSVRLDRPLRAACYCVLPLTSRYPSAFLDAETDFQVAWADFLANGMASGMDPDPIQSQVFALADLLGGMALAIRDRVSSPEGTSPQLVAR